MSVLAPDAQDEADRIAGRLSAEEHKRRYEDALRRRWSDYHPGFLVIAPEGQYLLPSGHEALIPQPVRSGDTLCCSCSQEEAAAGRCHRVWAAQALARVGWHVVLDGAEVDDVGVEDPRQW